MFNFGEALTICGQKNKTTLLKIYVVSKTFLMISWITRKLLSSTKYEIPKVFKYDFNCGSLGLIILLELTLFRFFMYFSTTFKSEVATTLLVVTTISLLSDLIKLITTSDLIPLSDLLILVMWTFDQAIILLMLLKPIGIIICLHKRPLVVILSLGFPLFSGLLITWWISKILWDRSLGNGFLILIISLIFLSDI